MKQNNTSKPTIGSVRSIWIAGIAALTLGALPIEAAVTGTLVLATTNNTVNATNSLSAWTSGTNVLSTSDNLWGLASFLTNHWESNNKEGTLKEDSPLLKTTMSGLAFSNYVVRVIYLATTNTFDGKFGVQAGLSPSPLTLYDFSNGTQTGETFPPYVYQMEAVLGIAQDTTSISVYVDDLAGLGNFGTVIRGEYVGLSYEATAIPEPTSLIFLLLGGSLLFARRFRVE